MTDNYSHKESVFQDNPKVVGSKFNFLKSFLRLSYEIRIVDISYWQDPSKIDYDKLAASADGFIFRVAYGTGVTGKWQGSDPAFETHYYELCVKRGKPCGVYHFIVAYKPIKDQVDIMYKAIQGKILKLGLWCDVELEGGADPLKANHVIEYMTLAEEKMGELGIYTGRWCWYDIMGTEYKRYSSRKLWMGAYTSSPTNYIPHGWTSWFLWQYTSSAQLPGYAGGLDSNYFYGSRKQFNEWINGTIRTYPIMSMPHYSQRDPRWSSIKLGTSSVTIGGYGCLITAASMMVNYFGKMSDPKKMNEDLLRVGGYYKDNLFIFDKINDIYPDIVLDDVWVPTVSDDVSSRIDVALETKRPVIVMVDYNIATDLLDQHWVIIVGKNENGYVIVDPIDGVEKLFTEKYGNPEDHIYKIATYSKKVEENMLFRIEVLIPNLLIRTGPSILSPWLTGYASGTYEVFEEKNNYYRIGVGKWVSSDSRYVRKIEGLTIEEKVDKLWTAHPELH